MIIGLTGKNAAGKGVFAEHLRKLGFTCYSLSDVIREELTRQEKDHTRDNMINLGNQMRSEFGFGVFAKEINEKIKSKPHADYVIDSIRNPHEINELRKNKNFSLVGIQAPIEIRFKRMIERGRIGDAKSVEELRSMEERENLNNDSGQQLDKTFAMSDHVIDNVGTFEEFYLKIDKLLSKLKE